MITLITGAPGSGKSAALMEMLLDWQAKKRRIYVDVQQDGPAKGTPSIPDLAIDHVLLEDARKWHEPGQVEDGALIVMDEAQRVWRPTSSGSKISDDIQSLETHRHRGLDFLIVTQHPNLLHQNVRRLVGRHIHLRDVGWLGRHWYEWPEATNPESFRSAPVRKSYKLPKRVFSLYKSASLHVKPVRSVPRSMVVAGVALLVLGVLGWKLWSTISAKVNPVSAPKVTPSGAPSASAPGPGGQTLMTQPRSPIGALAVTAAVPEREPYAGLGLHLAGSLGGTTPHPRYWFTASVNGRAIATVTDRELLEAGYSWRALGPCLGVLLFGDRERVVTCDTPAGVSGAQGPLRAASGPAQSV